MSQPHYRKSHKGRNKHGHKGKPKNKSGSTNQSDDIPSTSRRLSSPLLCSSSSSPSPPPTSDSAERIIEQPFYVPEGAEEDFQSTSMTCQNGGHVVMHVSEQLQRYMEFDYEMITQNRKMHALPARISVISILEHFVKQTTVKLVFSNSQTEPIRPRAASQQNKKEREFEKLKATVNVLKEVADGVRIYFDFAIFDYLLYKEEKEYAISSMTDDSLRDFTYVPTSILDSDYFNPKYEVDPSFAAALDDGTGDAATASMAMYSDYVDVSKRKMRSKRNNFGDAMEEQFDDEAAAGCSTSAHGQSNTFSAHDIRALQPQIYRIPTHTKEFMQSVLAWHLLPANSAPAPSMIFGAQHLSRLMVKMPDFLNANLPPQEKLKPLLEHLESFINYMESHDEWFGDDNYGEYLTSEPVAEVSPKET